MTNRNDIPFRSATTDREVSPELLTLVGRIVARDPAMAGRFDRPGPMTDTEQEQAFLDLLKSVDQNAHLRGQSEASPEDLAEAWEEGRRDEARAWRSQGNPEGEFVPRNPYRAEAKGGQSTDG
jgi:hypothetical protein